MRGILTEHLYDDSHTDDCLLDEGVSLPNRYQSVHIYLVDKDVALQNRTHQYGYAAQVLVVLDQQNILDVLCDGGIGVEADIFIRVAIPLEEELEGENLPEVLCWNVSLINLAESTYVEFLAIPESESVKQVDDFMEIFLAVLVDGSGGTEDFIFGNIRKSFGVII
jgi:hypothetical protein